VREGLGRARDALADLADRRADFVGGAGALFGEPPNLLGDDGEALAVLTGAGGFNGGIEGEEVGLARDALNQLHKAANFGERIFQLVDLALGCVDHLARALQHLDRLGDAGPRTPRRRANLVAELARSVRNAAERACRSADVGEDGLRGREVLALCLGVAGNAGQRFADLAG
jgi:hypothetical protein